MPILPILAHLSVVIRTGEDGEKAVMDLIHGRVSASDFLAILEDIGEDFADAIVPIPSGLTLEAIQAAIASLSALLSPAPAPAAA
jgi:hypothetical protein